MYSPAGKLASPHCSLPQAPGNGNVLSQEGAAWAGCACRVPPGCPHLLSGSWEMRRPHDPPTLGRELCHTRLLAQRLILGEQPGGLEATSHSGCGVNCTVGWVGGPRSPSLPPSSEQKACPLPHSASFLFLYFALLFVPFLISRHLYADDITTSFWIRPMRVPQVQHPVPS